MDANNNIVDLATAIIAAYVSNNKVEAPELPNLIQTVYSGLKNIEQPAAPIEQPADKPSAAQIKKSILPDGLVSFIDGKKYQTLKRHLTTRGMTIAEYKAKYGLPHDYPVTAPNYSEKRSAMAKSMGLGARRRQTAPQKSPVEPRAKTDAPQTDA